jgi:hypothetical protein
LIRRSLFQVSLAASSLSRMRCAHRHAHRRCERNGALLSVRTRIRRRRSITHAKRRRHRCRQSQLARARACVSRSAGVSRRAASGQEPLIPCPSQDNSSRGRPSSNQQRWPLSPASALRLARAARTAKDLFRGFSLSGHSGRVDLFCHRRLRAKRRRRRAAPRARGPPTAGQNRPTILASKASTVKEVRANWPPRLIPGLDPRNLRRSDRC